VKRKVIRTSILLLVLLLPFVIWRLTLLADVSHRLAAIRAAGLPTDARELNEWYPAVPIGANAALLISTATKLCSIKNGEKDINDFKLSPPGKKLSETEQEWLKTQLDRNSKALAKVDEALRFAASRYPIDLSMAMKTELPHLMYLKRFALLYQGAAELAMSAGDSGAASTNISKILFLARTLDKEPTLISQLMRAKLVNFAVATLEKRLNEAPINDSELASLSTTFKETSGARSQLVTALVGERAMLATYFFVNDLEAARLLGAPADETARKSFPNHRSAALRIAGFYDLDLGFFLNSMDQALKVANSDSTLLGIAGYLMRAGEKAKSRHYVISGTLASYSSAIPRQLETEANLRLARTALVVEQYRREHGRIPDTLSDLNLGLAEFAMDPFSDELLHYQHLATGYVLYSVGRDRRDNGGKERPEEKHASSEDFDITLIVRR
jgi:hypothetical protein